MSFTYWLPRHLARKSNREDGCEICEGNFGE
jgi:hypothetical protein